MFIRQRALYAAVLSLGWPLINEQIIIATSGTTSINSIGVQIFITIFQSQGQLLLNIHLRELTSGNARLQEWVNIESLREFKQGFVKAFVSSKCLLISVEKCHFTDHCILTFPRPKRRTKLAEICHREQQQQITSKIHLLFPVPYCWFKSEREFDELRIGLKTWNA